MTVSIPPTFSTPLTSQTGYEDCVRTTKSDIVGGTKTTNSIRLVNKSSQDSTFYSFHFSQRQKTKTNITTNPFPCSTKQVRSTQQPFPVSSYTQELALFSSRCFTIKTLHFYPPVLTSPILDSKSSVSHKRKPNMRR
jgi:hypothetical protein